MKPLRTWVVAGLLALIAGVNMAWPAAPWGIACGDGRVDLILDDFDSPWDACCTAHPSIPMPARQTVAGCNGNAMAVGYDLRNVVPGNGPDAGTSWVVLQRSFAAPRNLTGYTHVRLAMKGANPDNHDNVEVKLKSANGLFTARLTSMTDLTQWRAVYIDLREFTGNGTPDLTNIQGLELAIVRCNDCEVWNVPAIGGAADPHTGTMYFDEFAAVDLKPGGAYRVAQSALESVAPNEAIRNDAARALLARITQWGPGTDLLPAWFTEPSPNFNSYAQAEALLVYVYEYERGRDTAFRDAAKRLAARLIELQITPDKIHSGAWYTAYSIQGDALGPPQRSTQSLPCNGDESDTRDIDNCQWVGNVGWVLIALAKLERSGFYEDDAALAGSLARGASWLAGQIGRNPEYADLISLGIEGNISAYFGLLAAGRLQDASRLGQGIFAHGWDPVQRRIKPGARTEDAATAIDVSGSWGVTFLRSIGRTPEALDSAGYSASVMRVSSFDGSKFGYGDIAGPFTPAVEFTAQAAAAGIKEADFVMQQVAALQISPGLPDAGAFPGAADHWYGGSLPPWNTTMPGVSPTAWVYFAHDRDPLADLMLPRLTLSVDQRSLRTGDTLTLSARVVPGAAQTKADVYILLQLPGCTMLACSLYWQGGMNFSSMPQPILRNWPIESVDAPVIFSYLFKGTEPAGSYAWLAKFVGPDSGEIIGTITQPTFTFAP